MPLGRCVRAQAARLRRQPVCEEQGVAHAVNGFHVQDGAALGVVGVTFEADDHFENMAREEAKRRGWTFEKIRGNLSLFERLLSGDWPENDFLVVPKGFRIKASYGENIIELEECKE